LHLAVMIVVASSPHCVVVFLLTQAAIDDDTSERMEATGVDAQKHSQGDVRRNVKFHLIVQNLCGNGNFDFCF
jgi:hypothetical protein